MNCTIDRIGSIRIVHVFDSVNERSSGALLQVLFDAAGETDGRIVLSLLESPEVDRAVARSLAAAARAVGPRVTLVVPEAPKGAGVATCFGDVFGGTSTATSMHDKEKV